MKKKTAEKILAIITAATLTIGLAGCGKTESASSAGTAETETTETVSEAASEETSEEDSGEAAAEGSGEVRTLKIARVFTSPPYNYNDEDGNQTGFETEVIKAAFALLPQYEIELIDTTDEDLLTGTETGKYDMGYKTAWYTEERAKTFVIPKESDGATTVGLLIRSEDADKYTDFKSFSEGGGKLVPLSPSNAQYSVVEEWNEQNPDYPIDLQPAESFDTTEAITWVLEGRYDGHIVTGHYYKYNIVEEDGAYHQFADQLNFFIYKAIETYPMFNKNNQQVADDFDEAIRQLQEDGTIYDLEIEYFGEDLYQYIDELSALH